MFNAIMTGEVWRRAPAWVSPLIALAVGLFMTWIVATFSPGRGLIAAVGLVTLVLVPIVWGLLRRGQGLPMFGAPTVAELEGERRREPAA